MFINKLNTKKLLLSWIIILFFLTACKKESNVVTEKNGFTMDISRDTINEFVPLHLTSISTDNCSYLWDFGNGTASVECNPTISYPYHGTYTISLQITDSQGISTLYSRQIVILCRYYKQIHSKGQLL